MKLKTILTFLLFFTAIAVFAEEPATSITKTVEPVTHIWQIMISLVLVLFLIFASAWLLKRFGRVNGLASSNMQILGNMSVGQRERIILLKIGEEQLLIGVTPSQINLLHELKEPIDVGNETGSFGIKNTFSQNFAIKLQKAMANNKKSIDGKNTKDNFK